MRLRDIPSSTLESNILTAYQAAGEVDSQEGLYWYFKAHDIAGTLGAQYGVGAECAAYVIAALSPNNPWETNVANADMLLARIIRGKIESHGYTTFNGNVEKAKNIVRAFLEGDSRWRENLRGPKVTAFARLIADPELADVVVIDTHAAHIAIGKTFPWGELRMTPKQLARIADAYRAVADEVGLRACELQAITWVWKRKQE